MNFRLPIRWRMLCTFISHLRPILQLLRSLHLEIALAIFHCISRLNRDNRILRPLRCLLGLIIQPQEFRVAPEGINRIGPAEPTHSPVRHCCMDEWIKECDRQIRLEAKPEFLIDPVQFAGTYGVLGGFKERGDFGILITKISASSEETKRPGRSCIRYDSDRGFKVSSHQSRPYDVGVQRSNLHVHTDTAKLRLNVDCRVIESIAIPHKGCEAEWLAIAIA